MYILQTLYSFVKTHFFMSEMQKDLEIMALRSQLAVLQEHLLNQKLKELTPILSISISYPSTLKSGLFFSSHSFRNSTVLCPRNQL